MISIIIPTLDEEKLIETTLRSLKEGLTLPHEIIVSDGGSSDRTVEIARCFADQLVEHRGAWRETIGQGRNQGARVAKGELRSGLLPLHTGRRAHAIGWPRLLSLWALNIAWRISFGRSFSKEWKPIR